MKQPNRGRRPWQSLRAQGWLATAALLLYLVAAGLYVAADRVQIFDLLKAVERLSAHEQALALTEAAVSGALVDVSDSSNAAVVDPAVPSDLQLYMENCTKLFRTLETYEAGYAPLQRAIARSYDGLVAQPVRAGWIDLREALRAATEALEKKRLRLAADREALTNGYHQRHDAATQRALLLASGGLLVFGALAAWFFARLTRDIRRLQGHAEQVVAGERGRALAVQREDELGDLMHAVNRMAEDLDQRERQIAIEAQQRSHQDKMLAVAALAAGVAHEVNNPLAVISGLAQELQATPEPGARQLAEKTKQILLQVQRAGQATRQLAEVAAPQPAEMDWVDLNRLLRQAAQMTGYDRRFRRFVFELQLDDSLPAVYTSAGAAQQVLMQLLTLVCEALSAQAQVPAPVAVLVRLLTVQDGDGAMVELQFPPALDFDRAETQRSLLLCRAIVEPLRGRLAFGQVPGPLQRIQWRLAAERGSDQG